MGAALHYLDYRVFWRAGGIHPGRHRSRSAGDGSEFRGHNPWYQARDVRRFDLRASIRDPLGRLMVREYNQRSTIPVQILADLSSSMAFRGCCSKLELLADFTSSLAYSAYRGGDPFAFIGCAERIRPEWMLPLRLARGHGIELAERLKTAKLAGGDAGALLQGAKRLGPRRSLVFLISDYHLPLDFVAGVLDSLRRHQIVPVVLQDSAEFALPARFGMALLRDLESGRRKSMLVRPSLKARLAARVQRHREALQELFASSNSRALVIEDRFRVDEVNRHFWA